MSSLVTPEDKQKTINAARLLKSQATMWQIKATSGHILSTYINVTGF